VIKAFINTDNYSSLMGANLNFILFLKFICRLKPVTFWWILVQADVLWKWYSVVNYTIIIHVHAFYCTLNTMYRNVYRMKNLQCTNSRVWDDWSKTPSPSVMANCQYLVVGLRDKSDIANNAVLRPGLDKYIDRDGQPADDALCFTGLRVQPSIVSIMTT